MAIEIINTGSELMLGRVLNTHQQWLCRQLSDLGYEVTRQTGVPDTAEAIESCVRESAQRADVVISTGGLGPTSDDLTRDRIAALLGRPLREDPAIVAHIASWFDARRRPMPASTRVQAMVPEGATVLANPNGTAPGLIMDARACRTSGRGDAPCWVIMLPGPPRELRPMFTDQVVPWLAQHLPLAELCRTLTLRTTGVGESAVEERLRVPLREFLDRGLDLAFCARVGEVEVRLEAKGEAQLSMLSPAAERAREALGSAVYGEGEIDLETTVVRLLQTAGKRLALAESCTGGLLANRITNVPGASTVLVGGWVTYADEAKRAWLGVPDALIAEHGAVSEPVALAMASAAASRSGADFALALTGIAGPTGGTAEKPVGTVWIALAGPGRPRAQRLVNAFDRPTFKWVSSQQALDMLRRELRGF
jgi:nicotinamide-nucleotide amidase